MIHNMKTEKKPFNNEPLSPTYRHAYVIEWRDSEEPSLILCTKDPHNDHLVVVCLSTSGHIGWVRVFPKALSYRGQENSGKYRLLRTIRLKDIAIFLSKGE